MLLQLLQVNGFNPAGALRQMCRADHKAEEGKTSKIMFSVMQEMHVFLKIQASTSNSGFNVRISLFISVFQSPPQTPEF